MGNIYSRKRGPVNQGLPAITWLPPSDEQSPTNKVKKWINKHSHKLNLKKIDGF